MDDLLRPLAPLSDSAWEAIDAEAKRALAATLAGRRLVDFAGPLGWSASAADLVGVTPLREAPAEGVTAHARQVRTLVEFRVPFEISREQAELIGRGAKAPDLAPVAEAARRIAMAEDRALFHGYAAAGIEGIMSAAEARTLQITDDYARYPGVVAEALGALKRAGVDGPYGIALGPRCHEGLSGALLGGGFRAYDHVARIIDGPVVAAPGIDGAVVVSLRGGDFELVVGQDFSIGYAEHSSESVTLYVQESFTFRVNDPEAAVPLTYTE